MINDIIKWTLRTFLIGVFWVFFLSINIEGRTLFSYANETFVENELVRTADRELLELWSKLYKAASLAFSDEGEFGRRSGQKVY